MPSVQTTDLAKKWAKRARRSFSSPASSAHGAEARGRAGGGAGGGIVAPADLPPPRKKSVVESVLTAPLSLIRAGDPRLRLRLSKAKPPDAPVRLDAALHGHAPTCTPTAIVVDRPLTRHSHHGTLTPRMMPVPIHIPLPSLRPPHCPSGAARFRRLRILLSAVAVRPAGRSSQGQGPGRRNSHRSAACDRHVAASATPKAASQQRAARGDCAGGDDSGGGGSGSFDSVPRNGR